MPPRNGARRKIAKTQSKLREFFSRETRSPYEALSGNINPEFADKTWEPKAYARRKANNEYPKPNPRLKRGIRRKK